MMRLPAILAPRGELRVDSVIQIASIGKDSIPAGTYEVWLYLNFGKASALPSASLAAGTLKL